MISPSGKQLELAYDDQRAVVVEVGGGLREYTAGGIDLLDSFGAEEMCPSGRGQLLIPWPNRIEDGSYEFEGRRHQIALNEPERQNAIHGLVRWSAWTTTELEPARLVVEHTLHPQPGYPFALQLSVTYTLSTRGLTVRTTATNVGRDACPYGAGAHPYLTVGAVSADAVVLQAPAQRVLHSDERGLPTGDEPVEGTDYDFRTPRAISGTKLDDTFTDLERDDDGVARVELMNPETGAALRLWVDESYRYLQLFTGDPLPDVNRRSIAVEPMTCPPNAFRTGNGVIRLEPGEPWTGAWGIEPSSSPRGDAGEPTPP